jgi:4-carboxymuconolactone decarboxylase
MRNALPPQPFEWLTHVPLALAAGTSPQTIDALREGRRPVSMSAQEALVHDFVTALWPARRPTASKAWHRCRFLSRPS